VNIWQEAEEILTAIKADLDEDPPRWESAAQNLKDLTLLVPEFPKFQRFNAGTPLPLADWRLAEIRAALTHLYLGLTTNDLNMALEGTALARDRVLSLP
jgi:uncharacterized protein (DUF2461 family)